MMGAHTNALRQVEALKALWTAVWLCNGASIEGVVEGTVVVVVVVVGIVVIATAGGRGHVKRCPALQWSRWHCWEQ